MTTLQKGIIAATLGVALTVALYEARRATRLLGEAQALRQDAAPLNERVQRLQRERDEARRQLVSLQADNERLTRGAAELVKLRGEVAVLRKQLTEANMAAPAASTVTTRTGQPADPAEQQKLMARAKGADGVRHAMHFIVFASANDGWFPTNWQQVANVATDHPVSGTNDFEMVHQRPINRSTLGTNAGTTILVREFLAWPTFDGKWGKVYGFADGHSEAVILDDGNFTAWEEQNTFNPESVSK